MTPLHIAAANGKTDVARYLVTRKKVNIEAVNKNGVRFLAKHLKAY